MHFTIYCTECGHTLTTTDDESEEGTAECDRCGSVIEYHVRKNTEVIRLKSYATMIFPDEKRRFLINCPKCGKKIAKSADGTDSTNKCPKCGAIIHHAIRNDSTYLRIEQTPGAVPAAAKP